MYDSDEMDDDGQIIPSHEGEKKLSNKEQKKAQKQKTKTESTFASYEEFAHLLDGDSDEET